MSTAVGAVVLGVLAPMLFQHMPGFITYPIAILSYWVYLSLSYHGSFKDKLLVYCLGYTMINLSQLMTASSFGVLGLAYEDHEAHLLIVSSIFGFALLYLLSRTWKSMTLVLSSGRLLAFLLFLSASF